MGNASNGGESYVAFIVIERPLIASLQPSETVTARLQVQDKVFNINEWPSQPFAVEPPAKGLLRCTFWAVAEDDDNEQRECGEVVLTREGLEKYEESAFQVWLRLMDNVPDGDPSNAEARSIFKESFEDASNVQASKVCITVALVPAGLLSGRQQDLMVYQRVLTERPVIGLLAHNSDVLREYYEAYKLVSEDLETAMRDFASKEKLYQGFVVSARTQKVQMMQRVKANNEHTADKWDSLMLWNDVKSSFVHWRKLCGSKKEKDLQDRLELRLEQMTWVSTKLKIVFEGEQRKMPASNLMILGMTEPFRIWRHHVRRARRTMAYVMRSFSNNKQQLELMFNAWQQAVAVLINQQLQQDNTVQKAAVSFRVTSVDFARASIKLHCEIEACIKQALVTVMASNASRQPAAATWNLGDHWQSKPIEEKHIRISLSSISTDGSGAVDCTVVLPRGRSVSSVRASLGTADELADKLTEKMKALPGMQRVCSGSVANIKVCDLEIFTLRERRTEDVRGVVSHVAGKIVDKSWDSEKLLTKMIALHSWREVVDKVQQEAKDDVNASLQKHLQDAMRKEHQEHVILLRSNMVRAFGDKQLGFLTQAVFHSWKDVLELKRTKRQTAAMVGERFAFIMSEASGTAELHTLFRGWKEQAVATRLLSEKEKATVLAEQRQELMLEKALTAWGSHNEEVTLHILIREWRAAIDEEKRVFQKAMELEGHQKIKELHDAKVMGVLLQIDGTNLEFLQHVFFSIWKDAVEDAKRDGTLSGVTAEAQRLRQLHKSSIGKLATQLTTADDAAFLHLIFSGWRLHCTQQKEVRGMSGTMEKIKGMHVTSMEKAMVVWGEENEVLVMQTLFHTWSRSVYELRLDRERAEAMAREQAVKEIHDTKMKFVLLKMESENDEFLLQLLMETWRDMTEEALHAEEVTEFAAETERVKHWHKKNMHQMLQRTAASTDGICVHIAFSGWKDILYYVKRTKQTAAHLQKVKASHESTVNKALMLWAAKELDIFKHVVLKGWNEEMWRVRMERKEAERLARQQQAKMQYESSVTSVILKLAEDNLNFIMTSFFRLWKDTWEEVKLAGKLGAQVQYFKNMHSDYMQAALRRTAEVDEGMTMHIVLSGWKEQVEERKRLMNITHHLNEIKEANSQSVDRALNIWGDGQRDVFLHTILHAWHEDAAGEMQQQKDADMLAKQQHAKEVYEQNVLSVLYKMEGDNKAFIQLAFFRGWKEAYEESQLKDEAARYRKLHSGKMVNMLARTAAVDDSIFLHVLYSGWKEEVWQSKQIRQIAGHLEETKKESAHSMERALAIWGNQHKDVILHTIVYAWHEFTRDLKEEQANADMLAREQIAKEQYDRKVLNVLTKMEGDNVAFLMMAFFRPWRDLTEETHMKTEKARYKKLHSGKMQGILGRTAALDDGAFVHALFAAWKEELWQRKQIQQITAHLDVAYQTSARSMERALVIWGQQHRDVVLHTILHAWNEFTRDLREEQERADALAREQLAKEQYDRKVLNVLRKMEEDNGAFILHAFFRPWRDLTEESHSKTEKARFKKLHSGKMQGMLARTASVDDNIFVHVAFSGWKEALWETKRIRQITEHLEEAKNESVQSMERALAIWGNQHKEVILHAILYSWLEFTRDLKEQQAAADQLAREQYAKNQYEQNVMSVLYKMEGDNAAFIQLAFFRGWKDAYEEAQLKDEAARYRKLHSGKMVNMLGRTANVNDSIFLHVLFAGWKEELFESKQMRQITDHLEESKKESAHSMERALAIWANQQKDVVLHTILHAWNEFVRDLKEEQANADMLAREQHAKEQYDRKVLNVLTKMEGDNVAFLLMAFFRPWRDFTEESHAKTEKARFKKLHSGRMQSILFRTASVDDNIFLHVMFSGWKEELWEAKRIRQITGHLEVAKQESAHSMERALAIWGNQHKDVVLHTILYAWLEFTRDLKEQQEKADTLAREQVVKEQYDRKVLNVLTKMEGDNAVFLMMAFFRPWRDLTEESHANTEKARFKRLHSGKMQAILGRTASLDENTFLHALFAAWKEELWEKKQLQQITDHLDRAYQTSARSMERALGIWGQQFRDVALHTILHAWHEDARDRRFEQADLERLRQQARAKDEYDSRVLGVISKMQSDNVAFIQLNLFRAWKEAYEESQLKTEAARYKKLHSKKVQGLLGRTALVDDSVMLHVLFATWKEIWIESRNLRRISAHMAVAKKVSDHSMGRALVLWGQHHKDVVLHTILVSWHEDVAAEKAMAAEATRIAEKKRAKELYDYKVLGVLQKMTQDNHAYLLLTAFRAFNDFVEEIRMERRGVELSTVAARAEHLRRLHQGPVRQAVLKLAVVNDSLNMRSMLSCWKEYVADLVNTRRTSERLRVVNAKNSTVMDKAMVRWDSTSDVLTLHMVLHAWMQDYLEEQALRGRNIAAEALRAKKAEHDARMLFVLYKFTEADSSTSAQGVFQAWSIAIKEDKYQSTMARLKASLTYLLSLHAGPVHSMVERFGRHLEAILVSCMFFCWREFTLERRMLRHLRMHVGDTKARHSFAMDKAAIAWSGSNTQVLGHLAMQCWLRVAVENLEWKTRARLISMTDTADRLKHINKTGVGAIVSRVALASSSVSSLTAFALWRQFVEDVKNEREILREAMRLDQAHIKMLSTFLISIIRKTFLAWKQEQILAHRRFLESMKVQMTKQAEDHKGQQHQLRNQVGGLQHQLAVQLLAAEHNVEETHSHAFHLGSCVEELKGTCNSNHDTLNELERELELFEAQLTGTQLHRLKA